MIYKSSYSSTSDIQQGYEYYMIINVLQKVSHITFFRWIILSMDNCLQMNRHIYEFKLQIKYIF